MNVYFIARNYIKENAFQYLIKVLKVNAIFSFIDVDDMSDDLKKQLGSKLTHYRRYLKRGGNVNDFIYKCVTYITGLTVKTHYVDGSLERVDLDNFKESKYNNPIKNLKNTEDKNVLVICDMYEKELSEYLTIPVFHEVTREVEYFSDDETEHTYHVDAVTDLAMFVFNWLNKYTGSDKYRDRICFYRFGRDNEELFFHKKWGIPVAKTNDGKELRRGFYKYVIRELNNEFPDVFKATEKNGKRLFTTFYNRSKIQQEDSAKYSCEEEPYTDDGVDWQREVDEMNRAFWRECGEAGSNCESWPGWD